jgi:hypothetical protein
MSGYGRVISGGAQVSKGNNTKQINDKLEGFEEKHERSGKIAGAVREGMNNVVMEGPRRLKVNGGSFEANKSNYKYK